jgi:molybdopterin/thiamine biosynthesis adenylyltransferase
MSKEDKYVLKSKTLLISDPTSNNLFIEGQRSDVFLIEERDRAFYSILLDLLKTPSDLNVVHSTLNEKEVFVEINDLQSVISDLMNNKIIEVHSEYDGDTLNEMDLDKYDRQLHFMASMGMSMRDAFTAQEQLKSKHVVVLGVGGVGGHIAYALSVMGIGELTIIDQDHIELSNTSRQVLYDETDVGLSKVEVAKHKLTKYNRRLKLNAINKGVKSESDLMPILRDKKVDLFLLTADTPRGDIQYIVDQLCHQLSIPFLHGGPAGNFVFIGPFIIPGKTKTLSQLIKTRYQLAPDFKPINDRYVASIIEPYNATSANLLALEAFRFFTGVEALISVNKRQIMNMSTMATSTEVYDD